MLSTVSNFMVGVFGSRNQRLLTRYATLVAAANGPAAGIRIHALTGAERQHGCQRDRYCDPLHLRSPFSVRCLDCCPAGCRRPAA